jgi:hypothetical protein
MAIIIKQKTTIMKKIKFIALTMILTMITFFTNAQRQERYSYGQEADNGIGVYIHAAVGVSPKFERAYELEIGAKGIDSRFFVCAVGKVYDANTDNDQRSHFYYGLRLNYVIYMSDLTAIGPMATYLRHSTGEAGRNMSNDWEAGLRFYRFSANPGAIFKKMPLRFGTQTDLAVSKDLLKLSISTLSVGTSSCVSIKEDFPNPFIQVKSITRCGT